MIEAFHSPLSTTEDHIRAVQSARNLCANMTTTARKYLGKLGLISEQDIQEFQIFPYSPFYVYYNQYVDIWIWARIIIAIAIIAVFGVHFLVGGLNWLVSLSLVSSVYMIAVQMLGMMYQLNATATEISLVFVVMCMGFSTRFFIFFIDRYAISMQKLNEERQANAVKTMCRPLLWGVIGTKVFWLVPMLMSGSDYIKMFAAMCLGGSFFGIFYVPTLVYFLGKRHHIILQSEEQRSICRSPCKQGIKILFEGSSQV